MLASRLRTHQNRLAQKGHPWLGSRGVVALVARFVGGRRGEKSEEKKRSRGYILCLMKSLRTGNYRHCLLKAI